VTARARKRILRLEARAEAWRARAERARTRMELFRRRMAACLGEARAIEAALTGLERDQLRQARTATAHEIERTEGAACRA
jgi:hypothetical protein